MSFLCILTGCITIITIEVLNLRKVDIKQYDIHFDKKKNTFCVNKNVARPFTICRPLNVFIQVELRGWGMYIFECPWHTAAKYKI